MIAPIREDPIGERNPAPTNSPEDFFWYDLIIRCSTEGHTYNQNSSVIAEKTIPTQADIREQVSTMLSMNEDTKLTKPDAILYLDWLTYEKHMAVQSLLGSNPEATLEDFEEVADKKGIPCTME